MPANTWLVEVDVKDIWSNFKEIGLEESVKQIVARIRESGWRGLTAYPHTFDELVSNLEGSATLAEFNGWWDELYDLADSDRVWLATF